MNCPQRLHGPHSGSSSVFHSRRLRNHRRGPDRPGLTERPEQAGSHYLRTPLLSPHGPRKFAMIVIEINNAEELARQQAGWFKIFIGKTLGLDIQARVEQEVAERLRQELAKQGVQAEVRTE